MEKVLAPKARVLFLSTLSTQVQSAGVQPSGGFGIASGGFRIVSAGFGLAVARLGFASVGIRFASTSYHFVMGSIMDRFRIASVSHGSGLRLIKARTRSDKKFYGIDRPWLMEG